MKRILGLLALSLLLAGCGRETPPPATVPTQPTEPQILEEIFATEPERLEYAGIRLTFAPLVGEEAPVAEVYRQAAEVFEARTGAAVEIRWGAGETGDIYALPFGGDASGAQDLTALARNEAYARHSVAALVDQVVARYGFLAGIPQIPYAGGIYYNTAAFDSCGIDAPPQSWEDFLNVCRTLQSQGWETLALNGEDSYQAAWLHFERSLGEVGLGRAGQVEQLAEQVIELREAELLAPGTPSACPGGQNRLALSNAAMTLGTNALCAQVEAASGMDLSWGVFPWPGGEGGSGCYAYSDLLCVAGTAAEPQAAFDFLLLLCTGEFDQLRADVTNGIPADPANISPVRGALSILEKATRTQVPAPTGKQDTAAQRLWAGKYQNEKEFSKVWYDPA